MVDERTRQSNRLRACLKLYFPQMVAWFPDVQTPLVCALLKRWPSLHELRRAHPGTLRRFFHEQNCRSETLIQQRIDAVYAAMPATEDSAVVQAGVLQAQQLVRLLEVLAQNIAETDVQIAEQYGAHEDAFIYASLPGAGKALEPRLLVAMGTDRTRYDSAAELACHSGIAPTTSKSGRSCRVSFRYACPKFLRQTFQEFASHSVGSCDWARAFYLKQRRHNCSHQAAVRSLAYKWIRIIFRCWKERKPYNEQTYLDSLQRHHSPFTGAVWTTEAGFHKLALKSS